MALGTTEDFGGNADKEEEEFVVTDVVASTRVVSKRKVDEVEETGADRRELIMRLRLGYVSVDGG